MRPPRDAPPPWVKRPTEELDPAQRDAYERRRELVASAAETLVAERGTGITMADVSRAAGIGMSSVYRTFASKEELLALLDRRRARRRAAVWSRARDADDARAAVVDAIWAFAGLDRPGPAAGEPDRTGGSGRAGAPERGPLDVADAAERVLERARGAGLRADVGPEDVVRAGRIVDALPETAGDEARRRMVSIYVDGLFAPGAGPLPEARS